MHIRNVVFSLLVFSVVLAAGLTTAEAADAPLKIGIVNIEQVLLNSTAGQEAKKALEAEELKHKTEFQKEKDKMDKLQEEVEKKSSAWSDEVRREKELEFKKQAREVQARLEEAQIKLQQLRKKVMAPLFEKLRTVMNDVGKKHGFSMIFDATGPTGLIYADETLNISDLVAKEFEAKGGK